MLPDPQDPQFDPPSGDAVSSPGVLRSSDYRSLPTPLISSLPPPHVSSLPLPGGMGCSPGVSTSVVGTQTALTLSPGRLSFGVPPPYAAEPPIYSEDIPGE